MGLFKQKWNREIKSPVEGKTYSLSKVKDEVFSKKIMGDGIAIAPTSKYIYAPITGKVATLFPTKHAYGIVNKNGLSLLIHIGIDTVELNGKGFITHVKQNDKVKQGDLLAEIDIAYIKKHAPSVDVLMLVVQDSTVEISKIITNKIVTIKDTLIYIK